MKQEADLAVRFVRVPMPAVELVIHRAVRDLLQKFLRRRIHPAFIDPGEKVFKRSAIHRAGMGEDDAFPIPV